MDTYWCLKENRDKRPFLMGAGQQFNNGNAGIASTNLNGKLDVNGTIYQRGGQLYADYVFEPDSKLESIEEYAEYIWNNKHLKAVPKVEFNENEAGNT